ncbi:hypothetical protein DL767_008956 [Monosporascus sp. MG133]|nr:hypothetical protein DL767_008956 [Monosporascus sp. MG133]
MTQVASLQQKYIELLEKRISQLEEAVKDAASKDIKGAKESSHNDAKQSADNAEKKPDDKEEAGDKTDKPDETKSIGRYVVALRKWDSSSASYKDETVAEDSLQKKERKDVAYVFRRVVYETYFGDRRAYSELEIEDPSLVRLLKNEIDNKYPGVNFEGASIYMQAPFPAITHNWDRLQKRAQQDPESQPSKDLAHLLGRVETAEELEDYFKTKEVNSIAKVTTFETLWTVFAPKTLIVTKPFLGIPQLLEVSSSPLSAPGAMKKVSRLWMTAWCWDWDGKKMVKVYYDLKFRRFRGTMEISKLDYYPLSYYEGAEELQSTIRKRSKAFLKATMFCPTGAGQTFKYEGMAFVARRKVVSGSRDEDEDEDEFNDNNDEEDAAKARIVPIEGEIICDASAYLQYANAHRSHALGDLEHDEIGEATDDNESSFPKLEKEDLESSKALDSRHMLLIPPRLLGYSTREKLWGQFSVDQTNPPPGKQPQKFDHDLKLDKKYKDLIAALVNSHEARRGKQVEDVVHDKGKGLVLLLHGPPGVGKTLTAETIAEASGKPLFVVSVAEIGLDASRAEKNLDRLFNLATKWEAILLIDEADVFLETRGSTSDASRNALVSVLLRVLEYYKGVIILTTNRIKSIDVAVISRIHLAIRYEDLRPEQMRSIFKYFLDQLEPDDIQNRRKIEMFVDEYGHHYGLNGRQIRNVVSAALASARQKKTQGIGNGKLDEEHLKEVCEMTREFQEQLKRQFMMQRANNEVDTRFHSYGAM